MQFQIMRNMMRCWMLTLLFLGAAQAADPAATAMKQVVFVCEHGTVKSLMAANYFNALAAQKGLPVRAISRAVTPDPDPVPGKIADQLHKEGFDVAGFRATALQEADIQASVRVVTIGATLKDSSGLKDKAEAWNDVPPAGKDFQAAGKVLKNHIETLLQTLARP